MYRDHPVHSLLLLTTKTIAKTIIKRVVAAVKTKNPDDDDDASQPEDEQIDLQFVRFPRPRPEAPKIMILNSDLRNRYHERRATFLRNRRSLLVACKRHRGRYPACRTPNVWTPFDDEETGLIRHLELEHRVRLKRDERA